MMTKGHKALRKAMLISGLALLSACVPLPEKNGTGDDDGWQAQKGS